VQVRGGEKCCYCAGEGEGNAATVQVRGERGNAATVQGGGGGRGNEYQKLVLFVN